MSSPTAAHSDASRPLPKGPVFGWSNLRIEDAPGIPSVEDLRNIAFTTSGRAAIYQALLQAQIAPDSIVLVPTYHCPTMIAPVLLADCKPAYFGIREDGLPDLLNVDSMIGVQARAMIVSHYFGLAQSLREVREWCDERGIVLIEDCAHCYFGQAGERPIGAWGDYCTASLSKFLPVPEAGLLGSASRSLRPLTLSHQGTKAQIKGCADVVEIAVRHRRLPGLNSVLSYFFKLKQKRGMSDGCGEQQTSETESAAMMMLSSDMGRISRQPLAAAMLLRRALPRGRIVARRQRNFSLYARLLVGLRGAKALVSLPDKPIAPYVFPLWVEDADRVYQALKAEGFPVFRWDRIWPGTPTLPQDAGLRWSRHVLQLLCHQDLAEGDIRRCTARLHLLLELAKPCITSHKNNEKD